LVLGLKEDTSVSSFFSLAFYFLPPSLDMIKIMSAIIPTTSNTPVHTPALNISPMAWQLQKPALRNMINTDTGKIFVFILLVLSPVTGRSFFVR